MLKELLKSYGIEPEQVRFVRHSNTEIKISIGLNDN
jgi:coenzyme F420-reducing hydrogenase delta subunit